MCIEHQNTPITVSQSLYLLDGIPYDHLFRKRVILIICKFIYVRSDEPNMTILKKNK